MIPGIGLIKCALKSISTLLTGITHYWNFTSNKVDLVASWTPTTDTVSISGGSKIGNGCYFDGTTYFNLGSTAVNLATADFSISFHVYLQSLTNAYLFECWSTTPASRVLEIQVMSTGSFYVGVCDNADNTSAFSIQTYGAGNIAVINTWYHIVLTFKQNGNMVLYVNNAVKGTKAVGVRHLASTSLLVGRSYSSAAYLSGYMDELGMWNRELTTTEVAALYNGGAGKQYPF